MPGGIGSRQLKCSSAHWELAKKSWRGGAGKEEDGGEEKEKEQEKKSVKILQPSPDRSGHDTRNVT